MPTNLTQGAPPVTLHCASRREWIVGYIATLTFGWRVLAPESRPIEYLSSLGTAWWALQLSLPGDLFRTNASFASMAALGTHDHWAIWAWLLAIGGLVGTRLGPPALRALAMAGQMWFWLVIAVQLSETSPAWHGIRQSTGMGMYAIVAAFVCRYLMPLFALVITDGWALYGRFLQRWPWLQRWLHRRRGGSEGGLTR